MKTISLISIMFLNLNFAFAQDLYASHKQLENNKRIENDKTKQEKVFEFYDYSLDSYEEIDNTNIARHFLGNDIAYQLYLLEKLYTYKTPIGPGNPGTKTVIQKPDIYNCIHKINKSLRKQIKKGTISKTEACEELGHYLSVATAVISQNTIDFEAALKDAKSLEGQVKILKNTKLKAL